MSGNALKMLAVISMVIDHAAVALIENHILLSGQSQYAVLWQKADKVMRFIGRMAFPIFCYLIVEGFLHTRDVKKYGTRLLIFSLISEIPFDLAAFNTWFYPWYQNVYITLLLGLVAIGGIQKYGQEGSWWKQAAVFAGCCLSALLLKCDYGVFGVFFIVLLYLLYDNPWQQTIFGSLCLLWEPGAILAFVPIRMYNGTRGNKRWKWFFYVFYPAHLLVLTLIRAAM